MEEKLEEKIIVLNVLTYTKEGKTSTRLSFVIANPESVADNEHFKGFTELASFYDGEEVFKKIPKEMIGQVVKATFKTISNTKNPLIARQFINKITFNNNAISLL